MDPVGYKIHLFWDAWRKQFVLSLNFSKTVNSYKMSNHFLFSAVFLCVFVLIFTCLTLSESYNGALLQPGNGSVTAAMR